jgi:hypothetical protein
MHRVLSRLVPLAVVVLVAGCGPKADPNATAAKSDVQERMFQGRAAALGFRPPGVAQAIAAAAADSADRADSTTALAVYLEVRKAEEGVLMGTWLGDTTLVQVAGGTGLRGFARPGEAGADLLRLATTEAALFGPAAADLEPPADGRVRIWVVTPAGMMRREESAAEFLDPDRRSTPFLQEARLFARTTLGDVVEFEKGTAGTLESLGVTPKHTAAKLATALGLDPDSDY